MNIQMFGFEALWSPYLLVSTLVVILAYFYVTYFRARENFNKKRACTLLVP